MHSQRLTCVRQRQCQSACRQQSLDRWSRRITTQTSSSMGDYSHSGRVEWQDERRSCERGHSTYRPTVPSSGLAWRSAGARRRGRQCLPNVCELYFQSCMSAAAPAEAEACQLARGLHSLRCAVTGLGVFPHLSFLFPPYDVTGTLLPAVRCGVDCSMPCLLPVPDTRLGTGMPSLCRHHQAALMCHRLPRYPPV